MKNGLHLKSESELSGGGRQAKRIFPRGARPPVNSSVPNWDTPAPPPPKVPFVWREAPFLPAL